MLHLNHRIRELQQYEQRPTSSVHVKHERVRATTLKKATVPHHNQVPIVHKKKSKRTVRQVVVPAGMFKECMEGNVDAEAALLARLMAGRGGRVVSVQRYLP